MPIVAWQFSYPTKKFDQFQKMGCRILSLEYIPHLKQYKNIGLLALNWKNKIE